MSDDEFEYLPEEAAELGVTGPLPAVERVAVGPISALRWGSPPTTTLLHGAGLNAHTWDGTLLALGRSALALDLPGHGDSAWRDDFDYRPATNAVAVAEVLDALVPGVPQVVVGHSLGGFTAVALAAARPELVHAIVLVDASPASGSATRGRCPSSSRASRCSRPGRRSWTARSPPASARTAGGSAAASC